MNINFILPVNKEQIEKLLEIVVCPKTAQSLIYNEKLNCLITEDGTLSYEIDDGIPILLEPKPYNIEP